MSKAYSPDLRQKVLDFIAQGNTKREAAEIFMIGEDTIYRWIRYHKQTGLLSRPPRIFLPKKLDVSALKQYMETHHDHTLKEIGQALKVSYQTAWRWLKRLHITRKKRPYVTKKEAKKNDKPS